MIDFNINASSSKGLTQNSYSFMWGHFFNDDELESVSRYQTSPFEDDFYKYLFKTNYPAGTVLI
jgi:hypothetical protein